MTTYQWFLFFLAIQLVHGLGTWKLYVAAGRRAWEAFVPVYNAFVLMKIINRPVWWVLLLFVPIINIIMVLIVWVETVRSFDRNNSRDTFLVLVTFGLYLFYISYFTELKYVENRSIHPRTALGEWTSSILFAVVAATLVHTYFMQPFTIPTSSLEKTLLVGDFLLVSKVHYGARAPMTAVAFPMVHDTVPFVKRKSYLNFPQLPYFRFPGFQSIKRNDIVVFNWPVDTVRFFRDQSRIHIDKPIDKKSNYVKRAVGIAGDTLEVRDGFVYINGKQNVLPDRAKLQFSYWVKYKSFEQRLSDQQLYLQYGITDGTSQYNQETEEYKISAVTEEAFSRLKNHPYITSVRRDLSPKGEMEVSMYKDQNDQIIEYKKSMFPNNGLVNWNKDQMGPVYIPKAGDKIKIDSTNFSIYKRAIAEYEGNTITFDDGHVYLNGSSDPDPVYTFKQDYYWMMGDNRHNSEDSRYWGFVPFDHVVGKPVFVWMSIDGINDGIKNWKFRWDRFFTTVGGTGGTISYFKYFLIFIGGWYIVSIFLKRRKKA